MYIVPGSSGVVGGESQTKLQVDKGVEDHNSGLIDKSETGVGKVELRTIVVQLLCCGYECTAGFVD